MKFRIAAVVVSFIAALVTLLPLPHIAMMARAQLNTGNAAAESTATHGYVIAGKTHQGFLHPR
jgi:hypothetical protein